VASLGLAPSMVVVARVIMCLIATKAVVFAGQQDGGAATEKTVLRGTVVNAVTHQPVGRAVVASPDNRFATMTDERGRFRMVFKEMKSTAPATTAVFPGTNTAAQPQTTVDRPDFLIARRVGFLDLQMSGSPGVALARDQEELTIPLMPESRVVGRVTLVDGEGALGMQVALYRRTVESGRLRWVAAGSAQAKSDGEFRFADLQAGTYKLFSTELNDRDPVTSNPRGQQFGYPPDYYPGAADFGRGALITLGTGETFQATLTPERRRYYPVRIGITNGLNGAVPQVEVWKDGHPGPGYTLGYDFRDGTIGGTLPDGNYLVKVTSQTDNVLTGVTNLSVNGGPATGMVTLMAGVVVDVQINEEFGDSEQAQAIRQAENSAPPQSEQGGGDQPVRQRSLHRGTYTRLTLMSADEFDFRGELMAGAPSDPEAEGLVVPNVPPGEYRVRVQTPFGYVASVRCGDTDLQNSNLVVGAGASLQPIEVTLRDDGAEVDGSVVDVAKRSSRTALALLPGSAAGFVYFAPVREDGQLKEAVVQANGDFQVVQLPPGTYRVLAFEGPKQDLEYTNEDAMRKYDAQLITVVPRQKEQIRISLISE
jgi:hypothetical protein